LALEIFPQNTIVANWIRLARANIPFDGLPGRIAWLGHGEGTALALRVHDLVARGDSLAFLATIWTPAPWRIRTS
jgi:urocanate hydratase